MNHEEKQTTGLTKEEADELVNEIKDHIGEHRPFMLVLAAGDKKVNVLGHICCQTCATEMLARGIINIGDQSREQPEIVSENNLASMFEKMLGSNKNITVVSVKPTTSNTDGPTT